MPLLQCRYTYPGPFSFWHLLAVSLDESQRLVGTAGATITLGIGFLLKHPLEMSNLDYEGVEVHNFVPGNLFEMQMAMVNVDSTSGRAATISYFSENCLFGECLSWVAERLLDSEKKLV